MLTIKQLANAYFGEGSVWTKVHPEEHEETALALRRVEAAVRAQCAAELRASAADWRNGHGDFGRGEAITLEIAACGLDGTNYEEWEAKQERRTRRRSAVRGVPRG